VKPRENPAGVEETDPTKQGLKLIQFIEDSDITPVEETDPTKQGLKPRGNEHLGGDTMASKRPIQQNKD